MIARKFCLGPVALLLACTTDFLVGPAAEASTGAVAPSGTTSSSTTGLPTTGEPSSSSGEVTTSGGSSTAGEWTQGVTGPASSTTGGSSSSGGVQPIDCGVAFDNEACQTLGPACLWNDEGCVANICHDLSRFECGAIDCNWSGGEGCVYETPPSKDCDTNPCAALEAADCDNDPQCVFVGQTCALEGCVPCPSLDEDNCNKARMCSFDAGMCLHP